MSAGSTQRNPQRCLSGLRAGGPVLVKQGLESPQEEEEFHPPAAPNTPGTKAGPR